MPLTKATQNVVEGIVSTGSTGVSAGSFIVGQQYKITSLGTTTQSQWNTIAGTTGQTYVVGSLFTAATNGASSGNGAAAVARTLANRFADVVNVLDFGADPTGVVDSQPAIQAAIDFSVTNFRSKNIFVPAGEYLLTSTITFPNDSISGAGIILYGEGNDGWGSTFNGTQFLVSHTTGPAFKLRYSGQSIQSAVIKAIGNRAASNDYNSDNWGILIEPEDTPNSTVASASIKNVTITSHPSSGIVASGNVFQLYLEQVASVNNKGHGFVFDCGAITNRVNRGGQIGGVVMQNARSFGNKGNSIVAGLGFNPASNRTTSFSDLTTQTSLGAYRILIVDGDLDFNQVGGIDIQHPAGTNLYGFSAGFNSVLFGQNFTFLNTAWGGKQSTPLVALHVFGQNMNFINNRFIECGRVATIKAINSASYVSAGYKFDNCFIFNTNTADMSLAVVGQNTGLNVVKSFEWSGDLPPTVSLSSGIGNRIYNNSDGFFIQGAALSTGNGTTGNVLSGIYIPTLTNTTNVSSSTAYSLQYSRIGSTVTVSGRVGIFSTAASGAQTIINISLPIPSDFVAATNAGGAGSFISGTTANSTFTRIQADVANNNAIMDFNSNTITEQDIYFSFTYRII